MSNEYIYFVFSPRNFICLYIFRSRSEAAGKPGVRFMKDVRSCGQSRAHISRKTAAFL